MIREIKDKGGKGKPTKLEFTDESGEGRKADFSMWFQDSASQLDTDN